MKRGPESISTLQPPLFIPLALHLLPISRTSMLPLRSILRGWLHPGNIDQGRTALNLTVLVTGDQCAVDCDPLTYVGVEEYMRLL